MPTRVDSVIMDEVKRVEAEHPQALVTLLTPLGKIIYTAPACESLIGYTAAELTGRNFAQYIHPGDIPHALLALQDAMLNEQSVEVAARARHKHGKYMKVRGFAWKVIDPTTDQVYLLSCSEPQ